MSEHPFPGTHAARAREWSFFGSLRRRIVASTVTCVAWVSLILLYVAFWAHEFTLFQSVILVLVSIVVLLAALALTWITFGLRLANGDFE